MDGRKGDNGHNLRFWVDFGAMMGGGCRGGDEQGLAVEEGCLARDMSFGATIDVGWPEIDDFGWSCIFLCFFSIF